jgi:hypothetical protein
MTQKTKLLAGLGCIGLALAGATASAQSTVTVGTTTPAVGDGVQYLGDSATAGNAGVQYGSNQYIAGDNNACLGQTFTTGANADGYLLTSISFMQVANSSTWYSCNGLGSQGFRIFSTAAPSGGVQPITLLDQETLTYPELTSGGTAFNSTPGVNAWWVTVTLDTPITLQANTQYGFDLQTDGTGANGDFFMEWNGTRTDGLSGGQAIIDGANGYTPAAGSVWLGTGDNSGDRTFVAAMTALAPVPEPSTMALAGLGGLALLFLRRRQA